MADKSDLKAELERKKQRLAQIREEKKRKEEEKKKKESETHQKAEVAPEDSDLDRKRRETEALLQSIGISPEPSLVPTPISPSKSMSTPSEAGSQDSVEAAASRTLTWDTDPSVLQLQADSELGRRMHRLGPSKITQVDFLPREMVSYCKETQTPLAAHQYEDRAWRGMMTPLKMWLWAKAHRPKLDWHQVCPQSCCITRPHYHSRVSGFWSVNTNTLVLDCQPLHVWHDDITSFSRLGIQCQFDPGSLASDSGVHVKEQRLIPLAICLQSTGSEEILEHPAVQIPTDPKKQWALLIRNTGVFVISPEPACVCEPLLWVSGKVKDSRWKDEEEDEEVAEPKALPEMDPLEEEESKDTKEGVPQELTEEEKQQGGSSLSLSRLFYDERWSKHRVITCLDWSPQYPELLVASYNNNEDAPHEPDGVALVWNMKFKKSTPEYIYHCQRFGVERKRGMLVEDRGGEHLELIRPMIVAFEKEAASPVVSVGFARFHPNLLVGGTYSGQIVLWDNRSHRRTPVQRTPLSAAAHTHPVYCVNVVGTQNANNLITVSTDGRMCSWSLDMLSQPQESMELVYNKSKPVAVTGMAFPTGDVNNYIVGSEEGTVYTASRHGSKAGICEMFEGHQGPVTGISCHSAVGPVDFSHLFVTSSFDWTVKLWSTKACPRRAPGLEQRHSVYCLCHSLSLCLRRLSPSTSSCQPSMQNKPLYSFEDNADYVYDVMWSPVHPSLFAAVDGMGRLDLWNLNNDTEVPSASVTVEGSPALNRVRWSSGGREVAVGDSEGRVWIYDTGELAVPHTEDWACFGHTLMEIRANHGDGEDEGPVELAT
ncbi:hypothetical protein DNTS_004801 [Danionella cerebrum]|uniref:Dynein cytoplasmic 1 intermediate chain 1 n=1 Tax=Danionella cerebrum TaxID=2873325 RepID=A0A553RIV5_9TELE|nr:hypothetical protein DNTS_004801 [Danionella translucida]